MFLWFVGTAIVTIGFVFRDPRFDHRLLVIGSVLPLVDGAFGGTRALHSLTVAIGLLVVVMLATAGRRPIRAALLGLPIGMLLHLVFDAAWSDTRSFWWPFSGVGFDEHPELPVVARGVWSIVLEAVGLAICVWLWRANRLGDRARRRRFLTTGRLDVTVPGGAGRVG